MVRGRKFHCNLLYSGERREIVLIPEGISGMSGVANTDSEIGDYKLSILNIFILSRFILLKTLQH